ncbi:hypothetical protein [Moritella sp. Urea-trap-13]|uniref:type IV pilus modification PilV family protein n=1 Tax=Moritella sp. Urea-trap-13 TaxID=2058327 RepID=UPI000C32A7F0|nr:hypothetical protein [Moritella sp. Urea-trap-13]PKH04720.1 hypothetical protein CXF93_21120 [Moritella sp. Urea-trap-13]
MRRRHDTLQRGGSLLEVMICLFMLSTSIFGITGLKLTQAKIALQQSQYTAAWALMEYKLNELRSLADSSAGFTSLSTNLGGNLSAGDIQYDQHGFSLTWQVTALTILSTSSLLKEVEVKINWLDKTNAAQMISSNTILNQDVIVR